jgi:prefoldin alpha subunit
MAENQEEEMQKKYLEYKLLDEKIKQIREQSEMVEHQIMEIMSTLESLKEFSEVKDSSEVLVPLNNGIFARARIKKEDKVLVNVGSSIVVDKSIEETRQIIRKQKEEMQEVHAKMSINTQKLLMRAQKLEKELNELVSGKKE